MTRWSSERGVPRGADYDARFDALAASGVDVHGEVAFVQRFAPTSVLDAGCGTGRVAVELTRRGVGVVGVDVDPAMLDAARAKAPDLEWIEADLVGLDLRAGDGATRTFDVVVAAGNVVLFVAPGTEATVMARLARHVAPGGVLVQGFSLGRGYDLDGPDGLDAHLAAAGMTLVERFATWDGDPFTNTSDYAVSVHAPAT